jgi:hypothetical protein
MKTMFKTLIPLLMLASQSVLAMPCDVVSSSVVCKSVSGKYVYSARFCGFDSSVTDWSLSVSGVTVTTAKLETSWNGTLVNVYQINLSDENSDVERRVTIETSQKTGKGILVDESRTGNPAPWKTLKSEAVKCVVQN